MDAQQEQDAIVAAAAMNTGRRHHHRRLLRMTLLLWPSSSFFSLLLRRQVTSSSSAYHANAFNLHHRDITLERCRHPYNIKLFDFYRTNFHEKRNKKIVPSLPRKQNDVNDDNDAIFTLLLPSQQQHHHQGGDDMIVAALRLTKSKNDNQYTFLRSLCVSREHRHHGLATRLVKDWRIVWNNISIPPFSIAFLASGLGVHLSSISKTKSHG